MLSSLTNVKYDELYIRPQELDLVHLVSQEIKYHKAQNKTNPSIKFVLTSKVQSCRAYVDEFWFKQLLSNLITNAINHSKKGLIEISTNIVKKDNADFFQLRVSDEGTGIAEAELGTIFMPMERGSHSIGKVHGSGIGLAVAKEVVEAHQGNIVAMNNFKGGATFEVFIPLAI